MSALEIPQRWPLVTNPLNRASSFTQDGRLVNCYGELNPQTNEFDVIKRPGTETVSAFSAITGVAHGMYAWGTSPLITNPNLVQIRGTDVYFNTTNIGTVTGSQMDAFEPIRSVGATLFFKVNGLGYTMTSVAVTAISDVNWVAYGPANVAPGIAQLNGRCYVILYTGEIYSATNLNDATVWSTNFIVANDNPDFAVGIVRHLQYVLALKSSTIETFYDAGNPTGSPLSRVSGVRIPYGCANFASVVSIHDTLFWITNASNVLGNRVGLQVARMNELTPQIISTPSVNRLLAAYTLSRSFALYINGHRFYCIQFTNTTLTLVWDVDQQIWAEWNIPYTVSGYGPYGDKTYLQPYDNTGASTGGVFNYNQDLGYDQGNVAIPFDIYTPNMEFEVNREKYLSALYINGDQQPGSILQIRHSDDDYQSWSNFRNCDLSVKKPFITDEGSFFRRAYHFRHEANTPQRLRSCGLQMDIGTL